MNTHMTCTDIRQHWDARLDGDLPPEVAVTFDAHVHACPACRAAWQRESTWLDALASSRDELPGGSAQSRVDFTSAVLTRWQSERAPRRLILARIGPLVALAASLAIAAAVTWQVLTPATPPTPIAVSPPPGAGDPVGVLMQDMSDGMERQPAAVRSAIAQTTSIFDLDRLADLFDNKSPG